MTPPVRAVVEVHLRQVLLQLLHRPEPVVGVHLLQVLLLLHRTVLVLVLHGRVRRTEVPLPPAALAAATAPPPGCLPDRCCLSGTGSDDEQQHRVSSLSQKWLRSAVWRIVAVALPVWLIVSVGEALNRSGNHFKLGTTWRRGIIYSGRS